MIKSFAEAAASIGKAALLLALPVYVVVDVVRSSVSDAYVERRTDLCAPGGELPPSILGKMDVFLQCATVTEASFGGFTLAQVEEVREAAYRSGVEAGTEEYEDALLESVVGDSAFEDPVEEPIFLLPDDEVFEQAPLLQEFVVPNAGEDTLRRSLEGAREAANAAALQRFEIMAPSLQSLGMVEGR